MADSLDTNTEKHSGLNLKYWRHTHNNNWKAQAFRNLTDLKDLYLDNNLITDVSPLENLVNLYLLHRRNNDIVRGVRELNNLKNIDSAPFRGIQLEGNNSIPCADLDSLILELGEDVVYSQGSCSE